MIADVDLQVWLATQNIGGQAAVIPYVKSVKDMRLNYRMNVIRRGIGGTSRIRQVGNVDAPANISAPLAQVTLGLQNDDDCHVEVALHDADVALGVYRFDCPK